jgi:hypothetical protein
MTLWNWTQANASVEPGLGGEIAIKRHLATAAGRPQKLFGSASAPD